MGRKVKSAKSKKEKTRQEWPLVVYIWMFGLGLLGYLFVGLILLNSQPHPLHWLSGLVGAVAGYFIGWLWYRWRGDIV